MIAAKWEARCPDDMSTQGNDMLCKWCWAVVEREVSSFAKGHLKSSKHKTAKEQLPLAPTPLPLYRSRMLTLQPDPIASAAAPSHRLPTPTPTDPPLQFPHKPLTVPPSPPPPPHVPSGDLAPVEKPSGW